VYLRVKVATVGGEGGGKVVADEGFSTVDALYVAVKAGVACDNACQVSHFVEDTGEEIVFAECVACCRAEGCACEGLGEFGVVEWGGVNEPAYTVGIGVDEYGAAVGATVLVVFGNLGFG
jgi:hypothetical protein